MAGDFILAVASMMIAQLKNDNVTITLSKVKRVYFLYGLGFNFQVAVFVTISNKL